MADHDLEKGSSLNGKGSTLHGNVNDPTITGTDAAGAHGPHVPHTNNHKHHDYLPPHVTLNGGRSPHLRQIANPAPLGLFSFASTTLILSLVNTQARGVVTPDIIVGMALFCGGLVQILAGMWEFVCGNTFGATAFSSYGAFWLSFATVFIPGSGVIDSFKGDTAQLDNALAFYLLTWFIFTLIMFLASLRSNFGLMALFFFLDITFLLLMAGKFRPDMVGLTTAGGVFGCITAFIAYYVGASGLIHDKSSYFTIPVGELPKRTD